MTKIIDADVVLIYVLAIREKVTMAELRKLRSALLPEFYLDIDSLCISSAVYMSPLFRWLKDGSVGRGERLEGLSPQYIVDTYDCPEECRRRLCQSLQ